LPAELVANYKTPEELGEALYFEKRLFGKRFLSFG
jgi:hypothetical protein